jgi:hypothetical protein
MELVGRVGGESGKMCNSNVPPVRLRQGSGTLPAHFLRVKQVEKNEDLFSSPRPAPLGEYSTAYQTRWTNRGLKGQCHEIF